MNILCQMHNIADKSAALGILRKLVSYKDIVGKQHVTHTFFQIIFKVI